MLAPPVEGKSRRTSVFVLLIGLYCVGRLLQLYAGSLPSLLIVVLHVVPPALFALIHGKMTYGLRAALVFMVLTLGAGTIFESISLRTGFPFGHYYFTDLMGPKLFQLPVLLALAYVGMGYLAWSVASKIVGDGHVVLLPVVASFVMVAWDLSMDPVWANIDHAWVWKEGGSYFGVPVSNFLGWFLTVYVGYQAFALYLRSQAPLPAEQGHGRSCVLFYGVSALGNILLAIPSGMPELVTDGAGRQWQTSSIIAACVLISTFVMGAFTLIALARVAARAARNTAAAPAS